MTTRRYRFVSVLAFMFLLLSTIFILLANRGDKGSAEANEDGIKYYVGVGGSDANSGLSSDAPLATINKGVEKASPGDEVIVLPGSYNQTVILNKSGTTDRPITIKGTDKNNTIIDGAGGTQACIQMATGSEIRHVANITIENLSAINCGSGAGPNTGFAVVGWYDTDNIILRNLIFSNLGTPIKFSAAPNCLLYYPNRSCTPYISDTLHIENITAANYSGEGISLGGGHGGGVVSHVSIMNVNFTGPTGGNNTGVDGISTECATEGCAVFVDENGVEGDVLRDGPGGTTGNPVYIGGISIENATILSSLGDGIDLKADDVNVRKVKVTNIPRNGMKLWGKRVFVENSIVQSILLECLVIAADAGGPFHFRNNVFSADNSIPFRAADHTVSADIYLYGNILHTITDSNTGRGLEVGTNLNLVAKNNIIYKKYWTVDNPTAPNIWVASQGVCSTVALNNNTCATATNTKSIDPQFNDPANGDYTLKSSSPAINHINGTVGGCTLEACTDYPAIDLLGNSRPEPSGTLADAGAYEYGSSGGRPFITPLSDIHSYPEMFEGITADVAGGQQYEWTKVSGPGNLTINQSGISAQISADIDGVNTVRFSASNSYGTTETAFDFIVHKLADINGDGSIAFADFSILLSNWGTPTNQLANLARTGASSETVNFADFSVLLSRWGS